MNKFACHSEAELRMGETLSIPSLGGGRSCVILPAKSLQIRERVFGGYDSISCHPEERTFCIGEKELYSGSHDDLDMKEILKSEIPDGRSPVSECQSEHKSKAHVSDWQERKVFTRQHQQSGYCLSDSEIFAECEGFWAKNANLFCPKPETRLSQKFKDSEFSRFRLNLKMTKTAACFVPFNGRAC